MTLTFQLLCNFEKSVKLFNCPEMLKLCIKSVFFLFLMAALVVVCVLPKSSPVQFLEVREPSHCQCVKWTKQLKETIIAPVTYALFLDEQSLNLHIIGQEALHVSCSLYCAGTCAVISCNTKHITLPETCYT